ncbi:MAG: hypothetical protein IJR50_00680 [Treponema sp.]|nr:hypothetical protein [Treponema sp.]
MKKMLMCAAVAFLSFTLFAQRAEYITDMIETSTATYGKVSYLSAVYQGLVGESASYADAFIALQKAGQIRSSVGQNDVVSLKELSRIMAKLWNIKGGLMYRITKGSGRYAFRQFKADGILSNDANPSKKVSGVEVLNLYTACQQKYGDAQ